ncbi:MAG TPA: hypothetical protein VEK82_04415 [Stellaceae bacterium]|nr:hypothetical protein [Stellaceae bacterium]
MKTCRLIVAAAAVAVILPAHPASPGVGDPLNTLYIFPGVRDSGEADNTGVATSIHCSNFSSVLEKIQYIVLNYDGHTKVNSIGNIGPAQTKTVSTHQTQLYFEDVALNTGAIEQGVVGVSATNNNMVCTAQVLDASANVPRGIDLHGIRLNPIPGTQE